MKSIQPNDIVFATEVFKPFVLPDGTIRQDTFYIPVGVVVGALQKVFVTLEEDDKLCMKSVILNEVDKGYVEGYHHGSLFAVEELKKVFHALLVHDKDEKAVLK